MLKQESRGIKVQLNEAQTAVSNQVRFFHRDLLALPTLTINFKHFEGSNVVWVGR